MRQVKPISHIFFKSVCDEPFPVIKVKTNIEPVSLCYLQAPKNQENVKTNYLVSLHRPNAYNEIKQYRDMVARLLRQQGKDCYQPQNVANKNNPRKHGW